MARSLSALALTLAALGFAGSAQAQMEEDDNAIAARFQAEAAAKKQAEADKIEAERKAKAAAEAAAKARKEKEDAEAAADWAAMTPAERTAAREQHALNQALLELAKQGATVQVAPPKAEPKPEPTVLQRVGAGLKAAGDSMKQSAGKTTDCITTGSGDSAHTTCTTR